MQAKVICCGECRNSRVIDGARVVIHELIIAYKMYYVYIHVGIHITHRKDNFIPLFLLTKRIKIKENIARGNARVQFETIDCASGFVFIAFNRKIIMCSE